MAKGNNKVFVSREKFAFYLHTQKEENVKYIPFSLLQNNDSNFISNAIHNQSTQAI